MTNSTAAFSGSLRNVCTLADLKLNRLLDTIDQWAAAAGLDGEPGARLEPTRVDENPKLLIDLVAEGFKTVVWATGFHDSWLHVPVFDRKGEIRHDGGVVPTPRGSTGSGSTSCVDASPASYTAPKTTPRTSSTTWRAT